MEDKKLNNNIQMGFIEDYKLNEAKYLQNRKFKIYHDDTRRFIQTCNFCLPGRLSSNFKTIQELILNPQYSEFEIPKKNKSVRKIQAPNPDLKRVQSNLNEILQIYYYYWIKPDFVHGFVIRPKGELKMCNIVSNASSHVGKKFVLNIDLKDFFSSISTKRVYDFFSSELFQFSDNVAKTLTFLCTYKGFLPTGAPTSPVISNFICLVMDSELKSYCDHKSISLTRYADDLSFSSNEEFEPEIINEIKAIIFKHNLDVNPKKVYIKKSSCKQTVTGLIVNEKVNIDRRLLKKIRAMVFNLKTKGLNQAATKHFNGRNLNSKDICSSFLNQLDGYINFVGQVRGKDDTLYLKFQEVLKSSKN